METITMTTARLGFQHYGQYNSIATTGYVKDDALLPGTYGTGSVSRDEAASDTSSLQDYWDQGRVQAFSLLDIATIPVVPWIETVSERNGMRGVYTVKHRRTVLFSQQVEIQIADLPRRKPRVNLDRFAVDTDD